MLEFLIADERFNQQVSNKETREKEAIAYVNAHKDNIKSTAGRSVMLMDKRGSIPGTRKLEHMVENLGAAEIELTFAELHEIDTAFSKFKVRGARLSPEHMALIDR